MSTKKPIITVADASPENVFSVLDVSPQAAGKLRRFIDLLLLRRETVNLISVSTVEHLWHRHVLDSGQLIKHLPDMRYGRIIDIGSGGGFPGLVLAIIAGDSMRYPLTLVESDSRKCTFLRDVIDDCEIKAEVVNARIEALGFLKPALITARAIAPLERLLHLTRAQHHPRLTCLFMKGQKVDEELTALKNYRNIRVDRIASLTHQEGVIIKMTGFRKK